MPVKEVTNSVTYVGTIDWDRRLFDELIPLPKGTSYNAYLIKGQDKIALIDTVDPSHFCEFINNLKQCNVPKIDFIISLHAEQDHSGCIPNILELYPDAKVLTNSKCKEFLKDLLSIPDERILEIKDKETISLGNTTLQFFHTPWVHWPDSMLVYLKEDRILFSTDFLGSHLATSELFTWEDFSVYESAKRYYAEIMMPFRTSIKKYIEIIESLDISLIAPSHGPIYKKPSFILDAYKDWISDKVKNEVIIPYVSMHGSTQAMVEHLTNELIKRDIVVKPFHLTQTDLGELAISLVDAATVVIGSSTALVGAHPQVIYGTCLINALRPKTKFGTIIGSYGWGSKMLEQLKGMLTNLKIEFLEPVIVKGYPKKDDFDNLTNLAETILNKHRVCCQNI